MVRILRPKTTRTFITKLAVASFSALAILSQAKHARADLFPYVGKGPTITGVSSTEAWVAWYTIHHQGKSSFGNNCQTNALTGTPNDTIPTLNLSPTGTAFTDPNCSRYHKVHLTGLSPSTSYTFSIDKGFEDKSPATGHFTTAPAPGKPSAFQFVIFGDNRDNIITSSSTRPDHQLIVDTILANEPNAAFVVNVGDYALNYPAISGDDQGYSAFFEVERKLLASYPFVGLLGNHETMDTSFYDGLLSGPTISGQQHPYYFSYDWGNVHLAVLNSFEGPASIIKAGQKDPGLSDSQMQWLEQDLQTARTQGKQIFLFTHQGPFSYGIDSKAHGGSTEVRDKAIPLMLKYGVLGIFAGHDHYYERGHEACIDFFVVGGGGADMYDPDPAAKTLLMAKKQLSYVVVKVDGAGYAQAESKDATGKVFDQHLFRESSCTEPGDAGDPDTGADTGIGVKDSGQDSGNDVSVADSTVDAKQDGSVQVAEVDTSGGCGCRVARRDNGKAAWIALAIAGVLSARRNRKKKAADLS